MQRARWPATEKGDREAAFDFFNIARYAVSVNSCIRVASIAMTAACSPAPVTAMGRSIDAMAHTFRPASGALQGSRRTSRTLSYRRPFKQNRVGRPQRWSVRHVPCRAICRPAPIPTQGVMEARETLTVDSRRTFSEG
ncbi:hypothetical protein GCM10017781_32290 [Deinococcus metalli]|uniref:Uncharacterized protein n=1 Tax=Deinococcus metalli TaxID=1141878 RepID=A0ABQ3JRH3_9DEIO|nr:hypothetical protein GCM10017781_32290 [Deinococcus metalli]